jgi:hypothetical protein
MLLMPLHVSLHVSLFMTNEPGTFRLTVRPYQHVAGIHATRGGGGGRGGGRRGGQEERRGGEEGRGLIIAGNTCVIAGV